MSIARGARILMCSMVFLLTGLVHPGAAFAAGPAPINEAALVPTLSPTFTPWTCTRGRHGPVCRGERHLRLAAEAIDIPCAVSVWDRYREDRYQVRYYDRDNLNYFRSFRTRNVDEFGTSENGPVNGTVTTSAKFYETFAVRGDDTTLTTTTIGDVLNIRTTSGRQILRVVGTLVEPYDAEATFSGVVTKNGVRTRYRDVRYAVINSDAEFERMLCEAAVGR